MIYLDSSILLAELFDEEVRPPVEIWSQPLISSRLIEYEVWRRIHARDVAATHGEAAEDLLTRVAKVELSPVVLARALGPFPLPIRTLDGLHLSTMLYLTGDRIDLSLATFDRRMHDVAAASNIPALPMS